MGSYLSPPLLKVSHQPGVREIAGQKQAHHECFQGDIGRWRLIYPTLQYLPSGSGDSVHLSGRPVQPSYYLHSYQIFLPQSTQNGIEISSAGAASQPAQPL